MLLPITVSLALELPAEAARGILLTEVASTVDPPCIFISSAAVSYSSLMPTMADREVRSVLRWPRRCSGVVEYGCRPRYAVPGVDIRYIFQYFGCVTCSGENLMIC